MLEMLLARQLMDQFEMELIGFARKRSKPWISEFSGNPSTNEVVHDITIYLDNESKLVCRMALEKIGQADRERLA